MNAQKNVWSLCPSPVSAGKMDQFVVDQIREIGRDPGLVTETLAMPRMYVDERLLERDGDDHRVSELANEIVKLKRQHLMIWRWPWGSLAVF